MNTRRCQICQAIGVPVEYRITAKEGNAFYQWDVCASCRYAAIFPQRKTVAYLYPISLSKLTAPKRLCHMCSSETAIYRDTLTYQGQHSTMDLCFYCAESLEFEDDAISTRAALHNVSLVFGDVYAPPCPISYM